MRKNLVVLPILIIAITLLMSIAGDKVDAERRPVVLDEMGPSTVVQPPGGFPASQTLRQQQYQLTNLSSKDILFYNIAFVGERGTIVAESGSASYPPDDPPVLGAGEIKTITRRFIDNADTGKVQVQIDSILFADGSSYGPDALKRRAGYIASIETQFLEARSILTLLDSQGSEAVRKYLIRILEKPNAAIPKSAVNAVKASENAGNAAK